MALYARKQYELDLAELDKVDAMITRAVANGRVGGFAANKDYAKIEGIRRTLKGKLLATVMILSDNDKKAKCVDGVHHNAGCRCKGLALARVVEAQEKMC